MHDDVEAEAPRRCQTSGQVEHDCYFERIHYPIPVSVKKSTIHLITTAAPRPPSPISKVETLQVRPVRADTDGTFFRTGTALALYMAQLWMMGAGELPLSSAGMVDGTFFYRHRSLC